MDTPNNTSTPAVVPPSASGGGVVNAPYTQTGQTAPPAANTRQASTPANAPAGNMGTQDNNQANQQNAASNNGNATAQTVTGERTQTSQTSAIDFAALEREYARNQKLSNESYKRLQAAGIPKSMVDNYISAREQAAQASADKFVNDVYQMTGGQQGYEAMGKWANQNLTAQELETYNTIVTGQNQEAARFAVMGLHARFKAAQPPQNLVGGNASGAGAAGGASADGFKSADEMIRAMQDKRYGRDDAYTRDVERRVGLSKIFG